MTEEHSPEEQTTPPAPVPPKPPMPPAPAPQETVPPADIVVPNDNYDEVPEAPPRDSRLKSPVAAAILSLVPFGLGHLYLGQYTRALAFFVGFWVPILVLEVPLLSVFFYFFAIFDAVRQAQLINLAVEEGNELPASAFHGGIAAGVFLIVLGAVLLLQNWIDFYYVREFVQEWWPAFLIAIGAWFIFGAIRERSSAAEDDFTSEEF